MNEGLLKPCAVVVGHYGSGKTNFAVNLALELKRSHPDNPVRIPNPQSPIPNPQSPIPNPH